MQVHDLVRQSNISEAVTDPDLISTVADSSRQWYKNVRYVSGIGIGNTYKESMGAGCSRSKPWWEEEEIIALFKPDGMPKFLTHFRNGYTWRWEGDIACVPIEGCATLTISATAFFHGWIHLWCEVQHEVQHNGHYHSERFDRRGRMKSSDCPSRTHNDDVELFLSCPFCSLGIIREWLLTLRTQECSSCAKEEKHSARIKNAKAEIKVYRRRIEQRDCLANRVTSSETSSSSSCCSLI